MRTPIPLLAPFALALLLPGCGAGVIHGSLEVFDSGPPTYFEREPNDGAAGPDFLTVMAPGDTIEVCGAIDDGCCDPFDGFAIETTDAVELSFELTAHDGWSDLDLCIYDPWADVFLACFESAGSYESGSVAIGLPAVVHLVVRAWSGASDYTLRIETHALPGWFQAQSAPAAPSEGWESYRAEDPAPFEFRLETLSDATEDTPAVVRIHAVPTEAR